MQVLTVDFQANDAASLFTQSLKNTGFAVLKNHPIDWSMVENIYLEWQAFFNSDAPQQYYFDEAVQDGYFPPEISELAKGAAVKDLKEYYQLYFPHGRYPKEVSELAREYFNQIIALGKTLLTWIEAALPEHIQATLDRPLPEMVSAQQTMLRVLHYPPLAGEIPEGAIRAAAHEDINLITLLPAATEPGLQVQSLDGKWHDVQFDPETMIVNISDMLQEATGHYYRSTTHRVINPTKTRADISRMSLPTFVHPYPEVVLSERYTARSYLRERLIELGVVQAD